MKTKNPFIFVLTALSLLLTPPNVFSADPIVDPASDKAIEEAIRKVLKKPTGNLTDKDYEKITELGLDNLGLRTLTGLSKCRKLKSLFARNNQIENLAGLEGCREVTYLNIHHNFLMISRR